MHDTWMKVFWLNCTQVVRVLMFLSLFSFFFDRYIRLVRIRTNLSIIWWKVHQNRLNFAILNSHSTLGNNRKCKVHLIDISLTGCVGLVFCLNV